MALEEERVRRNESDDKLKDYRIGIKMSLEKMRSLFPSIQ